MKPKKEGYWFYKDEPVKVVFDEKYKLFIFYNFGDTDDYFGVVKTTQDSDWGYEIFNPCKDRCQVCCNDNRPCYGQQECRFKEGNGIAK